MKITIEFDDDIKREYEVDRYVYDALIDGEHVTVEFVHPNHGEICVIRIGQPFV